MQRDEDRHFHPGPLPQYPPHCLLQASPVGAQRDPAPGGEAPGPAGPGGDAGNEPSKVNCWRPPCSREGQMRGGEDGSGGRDVWRWEGKVRGRKSISEHRASRQELRSCRDPLKSHSPQHLCTEVACEKSAPKKTMWNALGNKSASVFVASPLCPGCQEAQQLTCHPQAPYREASHSSSPLAAPMQHDQFWDQDSHK